MQRPLNHGRELTSETVGRADEHFDGDRSFTSTRCRIYRTRDAWASLGPIEAESAQVTEGRTRGGNEHFDGDRSGLPAAAATALRTESRDREREEDELSLGRGGDQPLAGRARGLRADLRPPRGQPAALPGPAGGRQSRGGTGRRAVPDRVRAAQDVRRIARERAPVAIRDRLESVAEAPARRGPVAARERADGDGSRGGGGARERRGARRAPAVPARGRRDRGAAGRR